MTDNNADETAENSKLSRRTALALMGTSAVGGSAATSAFSKLTADRPVDLGVTTSTPEIAVSDSGNSELQITNNSGGALDTEVDSPERADLELENSSGGNVSGSGPWTVEISNDGDTATLEFENRGITDVQFDVTAFTNTSGFEISSSQSVSVTSAIRDHAFSASDDLSVKYNNSDLSTDSSYNFGNTVYSDGRFIYTGGENKIDKVDPLDMSIMTDDGGSNLTYDGLGRRVFVIASDGTYIYGGDINNEIHKVDPTDMTVVTDGSGSDEIYTGHTNNVEALAYGDSYLYSGGKEISVHKLDPTDMTEVTDGSGNLLQFDSMSGRPIEASYYNSYLYVAAADGIVHKIDPSDMTAATDGSGSAVEYNGSNAPWITHDGSYIYIGDGTEVLKANPSDLSIVQDGSGNDVKYTGHSSGTAAIGTDGTYVYSGDGDGEVHKINSSDMTIATDESSNNIIATAHSQGIQSMFVWR